MNWSQAAAIVFTDVAGWNVVRVSSRRLTVRGFGVRIWLSSGRPACSSATLRPNRDPAIPIRGWSRSL